jgi:hypothetical protein
LARLGKIVAEIKGFVDRAECSDGAESLISRTDSKIGLVHLYNDFDPGVLLSAAADNGIFAVDDGGTWAGCSELSLPFG